MFYKTGVDISSVKSMWEFLHEHFTYYTLNSWNRQKSIAHNVKVYNLNLDGDWTVAMRYLLDESDAGLLQMYIDDEIREFEEKYPYYEVFFNGRSGGYLVISEKQGHGSVLPECVAGYYDYEEFKNDCKYYNENVSDHNRELRDAVEIVREFDRLCDRLRDLVNEYSKRSFDVDKLTEAVDHFYSEYGEDLAALELEGPVIEADRVKLNTLADYRAFMHCFLECLGEDRRRIATDSADKYLWLREA